jgi:hypothetical protein
MLSDKNIESLCQGRIIYADMYDSSGKNSAGPHYGVMMDSDEAIREHDSYCVIPISNNDKIDRQFLIPVWAYLGLTGFFICSWLEEVHLAGIQKIGPKLLKPHYGEVLKMRRAYEDWKRTQGKP